MLRTSFTTAKIAAPVGPYSSAVRANGFAFLSGQVGRDPRTGRLVEGGVAAQGARAEINLIAVEAGVVSG